MGPSTSRVGPRFAGRGFTLIELMIVVAIVGILASMAAVSFNRFVSRAKQSEAKTNLKGIFVAKESYAIEKDRYDCGLCGWSPDGAAKYSYFGDDSGSPGFTGLNDCSPTVDFAEESTWEFTIVAAGNVDDDDYCDAWYLNDANELVNYENDVLFD